MNAKSKVQTTSNELDLKLLLNVLMEVRQGNFSVRMPLEWEGINGKIADALNDIIALGDKTSRGLEQVSQTVGQAGKLTERIPLGYADGAWARQIELVNALIADITGPVAAMSRVIGSVVNGDLTQRIALDADGRTMHGEFVRSAKAINAMVAQLDAFAAEVTQVVRDVGTEGKPNGQVQVHGTAGVWKDLAEAINQMILNLKATTDKNTEHDWLNTNMARFAGLLQGYHDRLAVFKLILSELAPLVHAQYGAFYAVESEADDVHLVLQASYAYKLRSDVAQKIQFGEGLVGECAVGQQRILVTNVPGNYVQINSALGEAKPLNIVVLPVMFGGETKAVIELASFELFTPTHLAFLDQFSQDIGTALNAMEANLRTETLLLESQEMAQELQTQQEELQQINEELEEKAQLMSDQNMEMEHRTKQVEIAKQVLEKKAAQLAQASKYKSEFLANMSHELRTPLNSMLLLSQHLRDNSEQNLTAKQVEYAATIYASGNDLLNLINDILDLAKIESGTVTADIGGVAFTDLRNFVERSFGLVAKDKKLDLTVELADGLPASIFTDERRLKQIIKNLLSNAFKFTPKGRVSMNVATASEGWSADHPTLGKAETVIAFAVSDTGIGIAQDKQQVIFEAFQQADGSTSRKYGGTGLGLSISRELTRLLNGEITLQSTLGAGTTFTLYLPLRGTVVGKDSSAVAPAKSGKSAGVRSATVANYAHTPKPDAPLADPAITMPDTKPGTKMDTGAAAAEKYDDDRSTIQPGDRVMLIVAGDAQFADVLLQFAHGRGFKALLAMQGQDALELAKQYRPDAITLDIQLPDISGWIVLDSLKHEAGTRHIPVHIISAEGEEERSRKLGALACIAKPTNNEALLQAFTRMEDFLAHKMKNLLVVEDDQLERDRIVELIGAGDVQITTAANGAEALAALKVTHFDCMVLDLKLPDTTGFEVIEEINQDPALRALPIIVYTARDLTHAEENRLNKATQSVIIKDVRSPERLLDEVTLFLHRVEADLPEAKRKILEQVRKTDPLLAHKKVLIVDDDMRNIFSLTAVLERHHMQVLYAESGREAINLLEKTPDLEIVLMDIMMPDMDGYDTMREMRNLPKFKSLPIIALTAKAMRGDREKCIEAGASDYITKPVNMDKLLSLLRVWLYR